MPRSTHAFALLCLLASSFSTAMPAQAGSQTPSYRTAMLRWRAQDANAGFGSWALQGVVAQADGTLRLSPNAPTEKDPYTAGSFNNRNFYNGGSFIVGTATSPEMPARFAFKEAIPSWNADTPAGSWLETLVRVKLGSRWSKWYNLGVWASDTSTVERHSVGGQADADGYTATDTLVVSNKKQSTSAVQVRVRLFSANGALPVLRNVGLATSAAPERPSALQPGNPALWNRALDLPDCSQMIYPDGGAVWCSPTSVSMVLGFWTTSTGPCEPQVKAAVAGVYDWVYNGHGNWAFNAAYAGQQQREAYVARFTTLRTVEQWVAAGVPVVVSFAWSKGDLAGVGIVQSDGHLAVIVGFDAQGNPILNDPAQPTDDRVNVTYDRADFETLWLEHSGGTVYLVYPSGMAVPAL